MLSVFSPHSPTADYLRAAAPGGDGGGLGGLMWRTNSATTDLVGVLARWWESGWLVPVTWAALFVLAAVVAALRAAAEWAVSDRAVWLEITPPARLPADGADGLWRLLHGCLRRTRRWRTHRGLRAGLFGPRPALSVEWWADAERTRAGVWVPGSVNCDRVTEAIRRAWPGAQVRLTYPPGWYYSPAVAELSPAGRRWSPLIDLTARPTRPGEPAADEPLRAVLGSLSHRRPGEQACVQLVITDTRGLAGLTGGGVGGLVRAALPALGSTVAGALATAGMFTLDLFSHPGTPSSLGHHGGEHGPGQRHDRSAGGGFGAGVGGGWGGGRRAARSAEEIKQVTRPHLHTTVRVAAGAAGQHPYAPNSRARAVVADISAGYDLITTHTPLRSRWRRRYGVDDHWFRRARGGFLACLAELGALWHLPAQPELYNLNPVNAPNRTPHQHNTRIRSTYPSGGRHPYTERATTPRPQPEPAPDQRPTPDTTPDTPDTRSDTAPGGRAPAGDTQPTDPPTDPRGTPSTGAHPAPDRRRPAPANQTPRPRTPDVGQPHPAQRPGQWLTGRADGWGV